MTEVTLYFVAVFKRGEVQNFLAGPYFDSDAAINVRTELRKTTRVTLVVAQVAIPAKLIAVIHD